MPLVLPSTPAALYHLPYFLRRLRAAVVIQAADLLGYWRRPNPRRATAFEETKLIDKLYWRYECTHPITQTDNGCTPNSFAKPHAPPVTPPIGFKAHTSLTISAAGNLIPSDPIQNSQNILFETVADLLFNLAVLTGT